MSRFSFYLRRRVQPQSLQARSLLYLFGVVLAIGVLLTTMGAVYQWTAAMGELEARGKIIARNLAQACVLPMVLEDHDALDRLVEDVYAQEDVIYVVLRDRDDKTLVNLTRDDSPHLEMSNRAPDKGPAVDRSADALHVVAWVSMDRRKKWDAADYLTDDPAASKFDEHEHLMLGSIHLGLSTERSGRQARRLVWQSAAGIALVLVLGGLVSFVLFKRGIVQPLESLMEATREVSRGHLDLQIERLGDAWEFGLLASAFNKMIYDLKQAKNQLVNINQELEERVRERTRALESANRDLLNVNVHLKELIELKSKFVSMVSHELRTPLATIKGFVSTLLQYKDRLSPEKRDQFLQIAKGESDRLSRLIEELLDISRIQEGRVEVRSEWIDLASIADRVIERYRLKHPKSTLSLQKPAGACKAYADPDKVEQIIINLFDNALRFSPPGSPVTCRLSLEEESARLEVMDEGPGLPPEELEKVFEAFYRAENEVNTKSPGTGLGLTICRALSEAMDGRLVAANRDPRGACFTLWLPRRALSPAEKPPDNKAKTTGG
jgi:signal transduction histidine kinase